KQNNVIKYLQSIKNELDLKDKYIDIIEEQDISGPELFKLTKKKLEMLGIPVGPTMRIVDYIQKLSIQLKLFSSYISKDDMKYVLSKYRITDLYKISCFKPGYNEAVHSRYIDIILQNSLHIAKQITKKQISLEPEFEIIDVEASGDVNYTFRMSKINSDSEEL
ncbi:36990_t:CDS:2, partial [Racocetra persica]